MTPAEAFAESIIRTEGGYVDHPNDPGGETIFGVARRYHPDWPGWERLDELRARNVRPWPEVVEDDDRIKEAARRFYVAKFWQPVGGDSLWAINRQCALEILDMAVNAGPGGAGEVLQRSLNARNQGVRWPAWPDLVVDSAIGTNTIKALRASLHYTGAERTVKGLRAFRAHYYIAIAERRERSEDFLDGWLDRALGPLQPREIPT